MNRFRYFTNNAGAQGCIFSGIVVIIALFGIVQDFRMGYWGVTVPILLSSLGLTYLVRNFLVENMPIARIVMNSVAVIAIAIAVLVPRLSGPEPLWLRAVIVGFLGTYMGCYFWMLSDERVGIV